jgi:hypothetical protein
MKPVEEGARDGFDPMKDSPSAVDLGMTELRTDKERSRLRSSPQQAEGCLDDACEARWSVVFTQGGAGTEG